MMGELSRVGVRVIALALWMALSMGPALRAQDAPPAPPGQPDLRSILDKQNQQLEQQSQQILELRQRLDAVSATRVVPVAPPPAADAKGTDAAIETYLKDHPGAGMPTGVQMGYTPNGYYIRSAPNPDYTNWKDLSKIPFELRIRGQMQMTYDFYKVTDTTNHLTGVDTGAATTGDFSQIEVKRARIIFEGSLFDPNLRWNITFDGNTRGVIASAGAPALGTGVKGVGGAGGPPGGAPIANVDHVVRIYQAWLAYDWHPCSSYKNCGPDCDSGTYLYQPTVTFLAGKVQPYMGIEEMMSQRFQQFVEFSMADFFFDADDNNELPAVGIQLKAAEDRFFAQLLVTNGNESQTPNINMDRLPGFNGGFWYDFGGTWNNQLKAWDLFGNGLSDLEYHCDPVVRLGASCNLVPMDRRSIYSTAELLRIRTAPGGIEGTQINQLLTGDDRGTPTAQNLTQFAIDAADSYTYELVAAMKYRGLSLSSDFWMRNVNNFRGQHVPGTNLDLPILYSSPVGGPGVTTAALFPAHHGFFDFGQQLQGGYFVVPKKLEVVGRWSWIMGQSGTPSGNNTFSLVTVPSIPGGPVKVINSAFSTYSEIDEFAVGFNYYFYGHLCKWQNDFSVYRGGNPAQGGQSLAGFIPGVDGWMVRSQIQLAF